MIQRDILPQIEHWVGKNKILILKGSRQVGKTTLLNILKASLETRGEKTFYLSVDQELGNPILEKSRNLIRFLKDQYGNQKIHLFLDEFQYLDKPGLFLKTLFDQGGDRIQIIVSGSSSLEITQNSEFLTGRKIEFLITPIQYHEFISYKNNLKLPQHISLSNYKNLKDFYETYEKYLQEGLSEYVTFGGYPEVVTTSAHEDKKVLLKELVRTYIEKDIIAFLRIENVSGFTMLLKLLADQVGQLMNKSELANTTGMSMDTVTKYLDILEGTYVFDFMKPYFKNRRKELSKMPKPYIHDFGMQKVILNQLTLAENYFSGQDRENFVYNALKTNLPKEALRFYRTLTKAEIDFIVEGEQGHYMMEVKSIKKPIPIPKIMHSFESAYPQKTLQKIIITDSHLDKTKETLFLPIALVPFVQF